ncbi:hypothetical protein BHM03_00012658 [Ensete ventricosum]|nr:hypothetical protein BHM03_00012658 [Ensete ventricosum]
MAAQPSSAERSSFSAQVVVDSPLFRYVVGNTFVQQYYHVFQQSPEHVYRFYQDSSKLGRPDAHGAMSSVTSTDVKEEQHAPDQTDVLPAEEEGVNEEEVYNPSDNGEVVEEEEPTGEVINEVPSNSESNAVTAQEEMPKKSYASIVKVMKDSASVSVPTRAYSKPTSIKPEPQAIPAPPAAPASDMSASSSTAAENSNVQEAESNDSLVSS